MNTLSLVYTSASHHKLRCHVTPHLNPTASLNVHLQKFLNPRHVGTDRKGCDWSAKSRNIFCYLTLLCNHHNFSAHWTNYRTFLWFHQTHQPLTMTKSYHDIPDSCITTSFIFKLRILSLGLFHFILLFFFLNHCQIFAAEFLPCWRQYSLKRKSGGVLGAQWVSREGVRGEGGGLMQGASFLKAESPQTPLCYSSTAFLGLWKINALCTANSS